MRHILRLVPALMLLAACHKGGTAPQRPFPSRSLLIAFYNLENLFDADDDPANSGDDEFTPDGPMKWTGERLEHKLDGIARAIRAMGEGAGPDLIGVCELENRRVLEMLTDDFLSAGMYRVAHAESPDERGIDVALLYRASAGELLRVTMHTVALPAGEHPTRDIMEATFAKEGRIYTVLVNHWPSKRGGAETSAPRRRAAADAAAYIVDSLTALDAGADVVLIGDLNDTPDAAPVTGDLDAAEYDGSPEFRHRMINTAAPVARTDTIGSYRYRDEWETIDQIMLATRGALDSAGIMLYTVDETVFAPEFLRDARFDPEARPPYRTYVRGTQYIGGVSDHFPVVLRVEWK